MGRPAENLSRESLLGPSAQARFVRATFHSSAVVPHSFSISMQRRNSERQVVLAACSLATLGDVGSRQIAGNTFAPVVTLGVGSTNIEQLASFASVCASPSRLNSPRAKTEQRTRERFRMVLFLLRSLPSFVFRCLQAKPPIYTRVLGIRFLTSFVPLYVCIYLCASVSVRLCLCIQGKFGLLLRPASWNILAMGTQPASN